MRIALLGFYGIDEKVFEQELRRNSLRALGLLVSMHTHTDAYQTTYIHTEPESTEEGKFQELYKPLFLEWFCFT